jgi:hypothetical protein
MSTVAQSKPANKAPENQFHKYSWLVPRFWHGMRFSTWMGLLARNRFSVSPSRWLTAIAVTLASLCDSFLAFLQWLFFSRRIARTQLKGTPLFIIGHWRSGTTYLHELFMLDERFTYPTTYECFAPSHSIVSGWFFTRYMKWLLPKQRPMDDVAAGWDRPQEDEFALCNLGLGSPYTQMAFPNRPQDQEYLELEQIPPTSLTRWKEGFVTFLKVVTCRDPKRIVLKSPPHTARVKVLLEIFPDARFVHIVRDPYVVFPSTMRLWKALYDVQGLQTPKFEGLDEFVFTSFERMYRAFDAQRELIPAGRLYEVRYEDLVRDPVGQVQKMYQQLDLGDFEAVRPALENQAAKAKEYKTNRYELPPDVHAQVTRRWGRYIERYGYGG